MVDPKPHKYDAFLAKALDAMPKKPKNSIPHHLHAYTIFQHPSALLRKHGGKYVVRFASKKAYICVLEIYTPESEGQILRLPVVHKRGHYVKFLDALGIDLHDCDVTMRSWYATESPVRAMFEPFTDRLSELSGDASAMDPLIVLTIEGIPLMSYLEHMRDSQEDFEEFV